MKANMQAIAKVRRLIEIPNKNKIDASDTVKNIKESKRKPVRKNPWLRL